MRSLAGWWGWWGRPPGWLWTAAEPRSSDPRAAAEAAPTLRPCSTSPTAEGNSWRMRWWNKSYGPYYSAVTAALPTSFSRCVIAQWMSSGLVRAGVCQTRILTFAGSEISIVALLVLPLPRTDGRLTCRLSGRSKKKNLPRFITERRA